MATITLATLCTAAVQREGLLSILESGLERLDPPRYPVVFAPVLVVRTDFGSHDFGFAHELRVAVSHEDGEQLSAIEFGTIYEQPGPDVVALTNFWTVIQPVPLQIRRDGIYLFEVTLDDSDTRVLKFGATQSADAEG